MKMMKKWISRAAVLLVALILVGTMLPVQADAAGRKDVPVVCISLDKSGDIVSAQPGVPVISGGDKLMICDSSFYGRNETYMAAVYGEDYVELTYLSSFDGMAIFSFSYSNDNACLVEGVPAVGETYTVLAMDRDGNGRSYEAVIEGYDSTPLESGCYALDVSHNISSDCLYPMVLVNDAGQLVAAITNKGAVSFVEPESGIFAGLLGGKSMIFIIGGAALVVLVVVAVLVLKPKKPKGNANVNIGGYNGGGYNGGGYNGGGYNGGGYDGGGYNGGDFDKDRTRMGGNAGTWVGVPVGTGMALVDNSGQLGGRTFGISQGGALVGRAPNADVRYPADTKGVSRNHCRLYWEGGNLMLMDVGSKSGTYVLGQGQLRPNTATIVREGDVICLGSKKVALTVRKN